MEAITAQMQALAIRPKKLPRWVQLYLEKSGETSIYYMDGNQLKFASLE